MNLMILLLACLASIVSAGGFLRSCDSQSIYYQKVKSGTDVTQGNLMIRATCVKRDQGRQYTELNLNRCFANAFGDLVYRENGNFQQSCRGCNLEGRETLTCSCDIRPNVSHFTAIGLNNFLKNIDGQLLCDWM